MRLLIQWHQCTWSLYHLRLSTMVKLQAQREKPSSTRIYFLLSHQNGEEKWNEVVENKIVCFAYMLLAEISIWCIWKRCLFRGFFIVGKKEVSQNLYSLMSAPKLALLFYLIIQSLGKGEACSSAKMIHGLWSNSMAISIPVSKTTGEIVWGYQGYYLNWKKMQGQSEQLSLWLQF